MEKRSTQSKRGQHGVKEANLESKRPIESQRGQLRVKDDNENEIKEPYVKEDYAYNQKEKKKRVQHKGIMTTQSKEDPMESKLDIAKSKRRKQSQKRNAQSKRTQQSQRGQCKVKEVTRVLKKTDLRQTGQH